MEVPAEICRPLASGRPVAVKPLVAGDTGARRALEAAYDVGAIQAPGASSVRRTARIVRASA